MLMMRAPAVRIMRSWPRAEAASSNLLALHRAVQKPAPTPHGTRARFAAIHQLISNFRVRVGDPAGARITSISGTPATRRRRVGGNGWPHLKRLRLYGYRQAPAARGCTHRRACCAGQHTHWRRVRTFLSKAVSAACFLFLLLVARHCFLVPAFWVAGFWAHGF